MVNIGNMFFYLQNSKYENIFLFCYNVQSILLSYKLKQNTLYV